MKAIILAGGFGTRLAKISGDKPKPLVEVAGKPIVQRQIEFLLSHGVSDIRLSLHHKADQIISFCENRWPNKFEYVVEPEPLGTGGGIKFASKGITEPFMVINGDILTDLDVRAFSKSRAHTIAGAYMEDARAFGLLNIADGKVVAFLEKPKDVQSGYINAGYYLLTPDAFAHTTQDRFMMETEVFPYLAQKGKLHAYMHHGYWIDVGTEDRWEKAHRDHQ